MLQEEKTIIIDIINEVIRSRSSKISKDDIEKLVTIREKIKNSKSKKGLLKTIGMFVPLLLGQQ